MKKMNKNQKKSLFFNPMNNISNYYQIQNPNSISTKNIKEKAPEQISNSFYISHNNNSLKSVNNSNNIKFNTNPNQSFNINNKITNKITVNKNKNNLNISNKTKPITKNILNKKINNQAKNMKNSRNQINNNNTYNNFYKKPFDNNEKNEPNDEKIKNYILYLKNNLNSSYYANNDLNNEYNKIINKSKEINESINNNNDIYTNMYKAFEEKIEQNKKFKQEYNNLIKQYKLNYSNDQNKLKELRQMNTLHDNDIAKLENENNILNEDISNKKIYLENLKKKINSLKNKKDIIDANNEYIFLFNKKNHLISLNDKIKKIKIIIDKNDELVPTINNLKNDLLLKENIITERNNIHNELSDKLNKLNQEEQLEYNNINSINNNNNQPDINKNIEKENEQNIYTININNNNTNIPNNFNKDKNTIDYYKKLSEEENQKNELINEKMNLYKDEIAKLKNEIYALKSKSNEEISLFKDYINNLSENNEEIKNILITNKQNIINQKENLLKYNKKFRESLLEKKDLENKIQQLKIENKNIELKLSGESKTIGFKIKAIKIRKAIKPKNGQNMERNLSDPDLIKNNVNDKLYISHNREHFIPANDMYRYKKFEYKYRNEKRLLNKYKIPKSSSFDNIFKYNLNNKIEQESNIDILNTPRTGEYLYTIDKDGKLLAYGINLKKYVYINTSSIKGWRIFYKDYKNNSNGSLLLNTLAGLFILTGKNYNHLYYYSQSKNIIFLIMILKCNHKYGGLIITKDNTKLLILGGINSNEVELFDISKNNLRNLPSLLTKRINSSYNIINDQYLIVFFGKNNNTIEYLDLNDIQNWVKLEYKSNDNITELSGHIGFHVNKNIVIIVGGENNDKIIVFYFKEKFLDVTDFILNFDVDCGIDELIFDKEKCFNIVENKEKISSNGKNTKEIMGMDNFGNVHCFNNDYAYTIFVF